MIALDGEILRHVRLPHLHGPVFGPETEWLHATRYSVSFEHSTSLHCTVFHHIEPYIYRENLKRSQADIGIMLFHSPAGESSLTCLKHTRTYGQLLQSQPSTRQFSCLAQTELRSNTHH